MNQIKKDDLKEGIECTKDLLQLLIPILQEAQRDYGYILPERLILLLNMQTEFWEKVEAKLD